MTEQNLQWFLGMLGPMVRETENIHYNLENFLSDQFVLRCHPNDKTFTMEETGEIAEAYFEASRHIYEANRAFAYLYNLLGGETKETALGFTIEKKPSNSLLENLSFDPTADYATAFDTKYDFDDSGNVIEELIAGGHNRLAEEIEDDGGYSKYCENEDRECKTLEPTDERMS